MRSFFLARCAVTPPAVLLLLAALLAACSGGSGPSGPDSSAPEQPVLEVSGTSLTLAERSSFTIRNRGAVPLDWAVEEDVPWLSAVPPAGRVTAGEVEVQLVTAIAGLPPGVAEGDVRIRSNGGAATLHVTLLVPPSAGPRVLTAAPSVIDLGQDGTSATLRLSLSGGGAEAWQATVTDPWLSLSPPAGSVGPAGTEIAVRVNRTGLAAGAYVGRLELHAAGQTAAASVTMQVAESSPGDPPPPSPAQGELTLSPSSIDFGTSTSTRTFTLSNTGQSALTWSAGEAESWLSLPATSGSLEAGRSTAVTATVARSGLADGSYDTLISVTAPGQTLTVAVLMEVAPPPPPPANGFSGSIADIFSSAGLPGILVTVGSAGAVTDLGGDFSTDLSLSGVQPVTLTGAGRVTRNTFANTGADLRNPLTMIPSSFDMAAYDDIAREAYSGQTIRWASGFSIYVDVRPEVGTGMAIPPGWIDAARAAAASFPDEWSDGVFDPAVSSGTSPPADGTPGTIVIRFDNTINPSGCGGKVGQAQFSWSSSGELRWGVIRLALSRLCGASDAVIRAVVGHEIGHTMGLGHSTLAGRPSLMEPSVRLTSLSALDRANATVQYHRAPGHSAPDRESSQYANLNFSRISVPGGNGPERTYVCGGDRDMPSPGEP